MMEDLAKEPVLSAEGPLQYSDLSFLTISCLRLALTGSTP